MDSMKILEALCTADGVSGNEENIRKIILSEIENFVDEYNIDNLGNILVFKKGKSRSNTKLMVSCHMDEVGFILTHVTKEGFLKFTPVGGINESVVFGKRVVIGSEKILGVIGSKPVHLMKSKEKADSFDEMYIDIGAKNKNDALKYVSVGDFISFDSFFDITSNRMIRAKALDDRVGCFLLIQMIKMELPFDMHFAFVVQEEVGLRGARTAAYSIDPDVAIVVEATTAADIPDVPEDKKVCRLNEGAVISFMDRSTIYDRKYYDLVLNIGKEMKVKVQSKEAVAGGNDAGAIHVSRRGIKTIAISLPCRYLHGPILQISQNDLNATKKILFETAKLIAGGVCDKSDVQNR